MEATVIYLLNGVKIYKFKAKDSELIDYPACLGNISKDFSGDSMKQTRENRYVYDISGGYGGIDVDDILNIHKYLMIKNNKK